MITLLMITASVFANYGSSSGDGETPKQISDQVGITKSAIDHMMRKMGESGTANGFNASDYKKQSELYKAAVEKAMIDFQDKLENSILKKLALWMNRYNSLHADPTYSKQQKSILLKQQYEIIQKQLTTVSKEYQDEIVKVYTAGNTPLVQSTNIAKKYRRLAFPFWIRFPAKLSADFWLLNDGSTKTVKYNVTNKNQIDHDGDDNQHPYKLFAKVPYFDHHTGWVKPKHVTFPMFEMLNANNYHGPAVDVYQKTLPQYLSPVFLDWIYPRIAEGCESQICLGLRAGDFTLYVSLVASKIDRDIDVKLADGKALKIEAPNYNTPIQLTVFLLSMTNYPQEAKQLPFDTEN